MCWVGIENLHLSLTSLNSNDLLLCSAIMDPQILELSGIGRPEILSKIKIDVKLELPGVGENVQEHVHFPMTFELDSKNLHETLDLMSNSGMLLNPTPPSQTKFPTL